MFLYLQKAVNMIDKMIELDPEIRIKCDQALEHPFLEHFHDPNDEPTSELFDEHYETEDCSIEEWKSK
jgi:p38 MAP kinase